jgi:hypothetical protein
MRFVIASLTLAAGVATAAHAQVPAAQPTQPQPAAAQPAAPGAQPATPAPGAEQPAPAAAPPAPAAEAAAPAPVPTLPTAGPAAEVISVIENICKPAVRGQKMDDLAKRAGFRQNRRDQTWAKPFQGGDRNHQIIIEPQFSNKTACSLEVRYPMGTDAEMAKALNVWAFIQQPPLDPTANYTQPQDPDGLKRVRRSWEYLTQGQSIGLNFSTVRKPDDTQVNARYDMGKVVYQERKL